MQTNYAKAACFNESKDFIFGLYEAASKKEKLSKAFQSYASIYNLVKKGRVPYTKAGNRYLLRICDIEKALLSDYSISSDGVRKIS